MARAAGFARVRPAVLFFRMRKSSPVAKPAAAESRPPAPRLMVIIEHPTLMEGRLSAAFFEGWRLIAVAARRDTNEHVAYLILDPARRV